MPYKDLISKIEREQEQSRAAEEAKAKKEDESNDINRMRNPGLPPYYYGRGNN